MKQQTAVEWLKQQYIERGETLPSGVFQEAKEMERDTLIGFYKWMKENDTAENAEQYFHYSDEDMLNEYLKTL